MRKVTAPGDDASSTPRSCHDPDQSLWIVVHGEAFVPEAFDSRAAAQEFADHQNTMAVSGPWEIVIPRFASSQLALEVYDAALRETESFAEDHIGEDLAYLLTAILRGSTCQWPPERPLVRLLRSCFPADHAVWRHITQMQGQ